jgi:hypothetical protein
MQKAKRMIVSAVAIAVVSLGLVGCGTSHEHPTSTTGKSDHPTKGKATTEHPTKGQATSEHPTSEHPK